LCERTIDVPEHLRKAELKDLKVIDTIGVGGFGRVELVSLFTCIKHILLFVCLSVYTNAYAFVVCLFPVASGALFAQKY